jgi:hypothetical protein
MFNPNLIGFAVEGSDRHYGMGEPQSHDEHLLGQAKKLVARLKRDSRVDFKRHWKVCKISILLLRQRVLTGKRHQGQLLFLRNFFQPFALMCLIKALGIEMQPST